MLEDQKINKLLELTRRAISINHILLDEERKFIEAVCEHKEIDFLKASSDTINLLMRKEVLYNQAVQKILQKQ
jgi:hypothetical protein